MDSEIFNSVWPVFFAEAKEHLEVLNTTVLALDDQRATAEQMDIASRAAHSIKGSGASLGLHDVELLAHTIEDLLTLTPKLPEVPKTVVKRVLRALALIEACLERADARDPQRPEGIEEAAADVRAEVLALKTVIAHAADAAVTAPAAPAGLDAGVYEIWSVFRVEALDHAELLVAAFTSPSLTLADEATRAQLAALEPHVLHLESTAATLGLGQVEGVASRLRSALASLLASGPYPALAALASAVGAIRDALAALDAGGTGEVVDARALTEGLAPAPELQVEHAEAPSTRADDAGSEARGAKQPEGTTIRVASGAIDALSHNLESLVLSGERQARHLSHLNEAREKSVELMTALKRVVSKLRTQAPHVSLEPLQEALGEAQLLSRLLTPLVTQGRQEREQFRLATTLLRRDLRQLRMVPVSTLLAPLRLAVRDTAERLQKDVSFVMTGQSVTLDRRIIDELKEPLVHMLRNAIDHGFEATAERPTLGKRAQGLLELSFETSGNRVQVRLRDDGRGLNRQRIVAVAVSRGLVTEAEGRALSIDEVHRLILRPGFSTAAEVTAISGRGVGMDVVNERVQRLMGTLAIASQPGVGTTITLELPLSLASTNGLLFEVGGEHFAVPLDNVERVLRLDPKTVGTVGGRQFAALGDVQLPFASLAQVFGLKQAAPQVPGQVYIVLVLKVGGQRALLGIDRTLAHRELIINNMPARAGAPGFYSGVAVLEDGNIVPVLNASETLRRLESLAGRGQRVAVRPRVLVVDDTLTTRVLMKSLLDVAGYDVVTAQDGIDALDVLEAQSCRLVVSDVEMPRLDGLALARRLRHDPRWANVPIVLVTSKDSEEDRRAGMEAGANGYVVKQDFERGKLINLVGQLVPLPS